MSAINPQERIEDPDLLPSNNYNNIKNTNVCTNCSIKKNDNFINHKICLDSKSEKIR